MKRIFWRPWRLLALCLLAVFAGPCLATDPAVLLAQIQALPGVASASQGVSPIPGTFFYRINFVQPVDHANPAGPSFLQRVTLLHRDQALPVVLVTDGYGTPNGATQQEITARLQTNQIRVEHRFFQPSAPASMDWSKLDIAQAAADLHAVIGSFKGLYAARWLSTGASKCGMTSVYLRYFYPDDVDATVPYVAPSSQGDYDGRYVQFLSRVGPADCRAALRSFQELALDRRQQVQALSPGGSFSALGRDRAYEFAVVETPFAFWQYQNADLCPYIPGAAASDQDILDFLNAIVGLDFYDDPTLEYYAPYFYQAATQLGGPRIDERSFGGRLLYPRQDVPENYPPLDVSKRFDNSVMPRIRQWVQARGSRMLFIYGENDPWSTNPYEPSARNDAWRLYVRGLGGNHGASIGRLSPEDRDFALAKLREWLGLPALRQSQASADDPAAFRIDEPTRAELFLR